MAFPGAFDGIMDQVHVIHNVMKFYSEIMHWLGSDRAFVWGLGGYLLGESSQAWRRLALQGMPGCCRLLWVAAQRSSVYDKLTAIVYALS